MSLLTLASIAVARDLTASGQPLAKYTTVSKMLVASLGTGKGQPAPGAQAPVHPAEQSAGQPDGGGQAPAGAVAAFAQLLVAQIPSEALLAYTTLLALFTVGGVSYNIGRWGLYAAAILSCAATVLGSYLAQRDYGFDDAQTAPAPAAGVNPPAADAAGPSQVAALAKLHPPYLPILAAVLSMAVYGLTVPGSPLQFEVSGTAFAIWSGSLAVGGGVMMSILAPLLGKGNAAKAVPKQSASPPLPPFSADGKTVAAARLTGLPHETGTFGPDTHDVAPAGAGVTIAPAHDVQDTSPCGPVSVTAASGTLTDVQMIDDAGKLIAGIMAPDNTSWKPAVPIGYGRTYTITVARRDSAGTLSTQASTFSTLTPTAQTTVYLNNTGNEALQNGGVYGVGIVIAAHFDHPIPDRAAAERALTVDTSPTVQGSWYWLDDQNAHWRAERYLAPGTTVTAAGNVYGVALGDGLYGRQDIRVSFTIGDSQVSIADGTTNQVSVYQNGVLVRTMPTAKGDTQQIDGQSPSRGRLGASRPGR